MIDSRIHSVQHTHFESSDILSNSSPPGCPLNVASYDSHFCSMAIWFREARHLAPHFNYLEELDDGVVSSGFLKRIVS